MLHFPPEFRWKLTGAPPHSALNPSGAAQLFALPIPHAVIGQPDWRSHIDDFKVGYLQNPADREGRNPSRRILLEYLCRSVQ